MAETNLAGKLKTGLPAELIGFIETAGSLTARQGQKLYLVGGVVRDLLLNKPNFDLDLIVEGNAVELAQKLAELKATSVSILPPPALRPTPSPAVSPPSNPVQSRTTSLAAILPLTPWPSVSIPAATAN
jgi:hypothetical protein